ncbi:MAG: lipopolysaccharide biosynthesis protein [Gemmatimonadales bacterium]|nr:lipopolysaccharide biosynthesis protein [Gemmatimonadales bacterium]
MTTRPSKAALLRSAFSGLASQYINVFVQGLVQLGLLALLARLLVPADFGLVGLATVFVGLATLLSQFGLRVGIIRLPTLTDRDVRAGFTLALVLGLAGTSLVALSAPLVAALFRSPELTPVLRVLSLTFILANPSLIAEALLERDLAWNRLMWVNLAAFVLGYAATAIALALLGWGYWALVGSQLAQTLWRSVLLLLTQSHPKRPLVSGRELRELTRFGGGFTLARLFNYGAQQGDYLVVGRVLGITPLGFYTRAFKLMQIPTQYFGLIVTKVLFPIMARLQHDPDQLRLTYLLGSAAIGLMSAPLSALMVVTAPELVQVLLGPRWVPAVIPFQVLTVGVVLRNGFLMAYCLDGAVGDMRKRTIRDGLYAASVLLGSVVGVRFGITGVAAAMLLAIVVNYLVAAGMSVQLLSCPWSEYLRAQTPGFVLGLIAVGLALVGRLSLQQLGATPLGVLIGTWALTSVLLLVLLFFRPSITGRYGVHLLRLAGSALAERMPARSLQWVAPYASGLVRRVANARNL